MVKAGALLYAIFITFILLVLSGIFLLSIYYYQVQVGQLIKVTELNDDVKSALNIYLSSEDLSDKKETTNIDLFDDGEHFVSVTTMRWGLYDIAFFQSEWKNLKVNEKVLVGQNISDNERISLYYTNSSDKLTLCGNTLIKGNVYIPDKIVERGYIEGKGYNKEELIYGQIGEADYELPKLNSFVFSMFNTFKKGEFGFDNQFFNYEEFVQGADQVIENSFGHKTLVLYSDRTLYLEENTFIGNIIVIAKGDIIISNTAKLQDIILFGENIEIESGFIGNFQAFSTKSIMLEEGCLLFYPTVLCVNSENDANISIGSNSKIIGDVISYTSEINSNSKVLINKGSIIQGMVYTNNKIEPKGSIYGSLYCNNIELNTKSSVYNGYLMDAEINVSKLSKFYMSSNILADTYLKGKIKVLK